MNLWPLVSTGASTYRWFQFICSLIKTGFIREGILIIYIAMINSECVFLVDFDIEELLESKTT